MRGEQRPLAIGFPVYGLCRAHKEKSRVTLALPGFQKRVRGVASDILSYGIIFHGGMG